MSLASFAFCFFFALNAFGPDTATQAAGQAPATQETKKSAEAPKGTPTQEGTQQQNEPKQTPSASEKPATTTEPKEEAHAASPEKKGEEAQEVAEESAQGPAEEKVVDKDHPQAGEPKAPQKAGAKESLFSYEEAHKAARRGKRSLDVRTEKHEVAEGALYSVKEAIEAGEKRKKYVAEKPHEAKQPEPEKKEVEKKPAEKPEKAVKKSRRAKKKEGWQKIELGFAYKDVQLLRGSYSFETHFIGEMRNQSGRNFGIVKFMFSTYNKRGKLITEEPFQITNFYMGQVQTFKGTIVDTYKDIASHRVIFLSAAPTAMD